MRPISRPPRLARRLPLALATLLLLASAVGPVTAAASNAASRATLKD